MTGPSLAEVDAAIRAVLHERAVPSRIGHDPATFEFPGRVLSMRLVEGLPTRVRRIAIPCGAVVTPLARDCLRQRGIEVALASVSAPFAAGEWALAADGQSPRFAAYERLILAGGEPWATPGPGLDAAAAWVAAAETRGAVVLSDCGARSVWRLHREPTLRAALVHDAESLARASPLRPNVIVVEPSATSLPEWRHLVSRFRRLAFPSTPSHPPTSHATW